MLKIIHGADFHLDSPFSGLSPDQAARRRGEQRELLESAREEAQWLIRVVENLLSITRMGDAQARISKEPEPAEEVLGAAAQKFRRRFPQVGVTVSARRTC